MSRPVAGRVAEGLLSAHAPPDAPAAYDAATQRWLTYAALRDAVHEASERLGAARRLVFSFCRNDIASLALYLACFERGHPVALLDADMPAQFRSPLLDLYRPDVVANAGAIEEQSQRTTRALAPELALLLPTSGSTGSPKFVRLSRRNVLANADAIRDALGIAASDRAILSLPMHYSYGLSVVNSHLRAGASLVVTDASVASGDFWRVAKETGVTSMAGVPYTYQMLRRLGLEKVAPPSLKTLTQAGGRLAPELVAEFHAAIAKRGGEFFVMYGQTEATARIAILPADRIAEKAGSVGRALPGGTLRIDDNEIVYDGPNVMLGYAEGPGDLAKGDELGGTLRTGDMGRLDDDGFLYITGRTKRFTKVFGLRINLDDVEKLVRGIGPVAAVGVEDRVIVYSESDADTTPQRQALAAELRVHHTAVEFRRVERLPLMATGKVDYAALARAI